MSPESELKPLIDAAIAGDAAAYRRFLTLASAHLRGHVRGLLARTGAGRTTDAEDVVQEILVAVHTRRHTYDPTQPVMPWLATIARHKTIDWLRSGARRRGDVPVDDYEAILPAPETAPEAAGDLDRVLAHLPQALRGPFAAVKLEGASYAEAAVAAGMSESALKVAVHRAMKRLVAIFGSGT